VPDAPGGLRLHLVGGFLGSGKTTAIIQAARRLIREGKRVGIVTNDQGKYLVDTAFFRLEDLPTVEVTGGCFCCSYPDLERQLGVLKSTVRPDVIFAESVGSCADLVATVVKPLAELHQSPVPPASFSVFVDARLLWLHLRGADLPFSEEVVYIFTQQIEEAGLLVINKTDLLPQGQLDQLMELARAAYPQLPLLAQSSLSPEGVGRWVDWMESGQGRLPQDSLALDYNRYSTGEARLAWIDEELEILPGASAARECAIQAIQAVLDVFQTQRAAIGHLKFLVTGPTGPSAKISFTSLPEPGWRQQVPELRASKITLLVNGRVEAAADGLADQIDASLAAAAARLGCEVRVLHRDVFYPKAPNPTYRMG
jgi:Ni2+-binding GTPase involved in maturation of urease and hydrogenase